MGKIMLSILFSCNVFGIALVNNAKVPTCKEAVDSMQTASED